jgi:hypothetical protein
MFHIQLFTLKGGQEGITYGNVEVGVSFYTSRISDHASGGHIGIILLSRAILPREAFWASEKYTEDSPIELLHCAHTVLPKFQVDISGKALKYSVFDKNDTVRIALDCRHVIALLVLRSSPDEARDIYRSFHEFQRVHSHYSKKIERNSPPPA